MLITHEEAQMLEWHTLISYIVNFCSTEIGKQYCNNLQPLQFHEIISQYSKLNCVKEILRVGHYPDFTGIYDITLLLDKAAKGATLTIEEIFKIRQFLVGQHRICDFFKSVHYDTSILSELNTIDDCNDLFKLLTSSITENGNLNEHSYPILRKIQRDITELHSTIQKSLNSLIHSQNYQPIVQDKIYTIKNNRYVIPVKSSYKSKIKGTILDISSSGATLFIEPESIHELNNTLLYKELELQREIERILQILSFEIGSNATQLKNNSAKLAYLDFCTACARFAIVYNAHTPAVSPTPYFECINARHPLLAILLQDKVVPCSIHCGKSFNCLVISGVNTGGKTVLLKMLGLFALMVRHGLPITANPDSTIGYFENIYVDIGDEQNLMQSLSTFSGQIKNIVRILKKANDKSLVLIDEIIVGTDPKQGAAIAQAVLEYLASKNSIIAVTTHYSQLKEIASRDNRFENASVIFDINSMQPTYQVLLGIPGASYTIEIAKNLSLPDEIINKALSLLDSSSQSVDALLSKITEQSHALQQKEQELSLLKQELQKLKEEYNTKINELQSTIEKVSKEQATSFFNELQEYRNRIVDRIREIQSMSMKDATNLIQDITAFQEKVKGTINTLQKPHDNMVPCSDELAQRGKKVYVPSLQQYGTIEEIDYREKVVKVRMGTLASRFSFSDVYCIVESTTPVAAKKKYTVTKEQITSVPITIQTQYNTIDLRGLRVDEALQKLDYELDAMVKRNIPSVVVIHGHGTGSLKKAVRDYVKHSFYATNYRPGQPEEGGDGVTIIQLR
ncbi:MAG: endonuclease MutS2 [Spirochaetes bacterium]|nr:endonuclease MutS2 [Spirochaetota bacterium]